MLMIMLLWIYVAYDRQGIQAYPTGASESACDSMTPFHRYQLQTKPPPFAINVSANEYGPNEKIQVTLHVPCGRVEFKGFLLQARQVDSEGITLLGRFDEPEGSHSLRSCGIRGQAITHDINSPKTAMQFEWTAPPEASGHIVMTATVVENIRMFWVKIKSPIIRDRSSNTQVKDEETYPTPYLDCSITPKPSVRDDPCETENGCFARCESSTCDMAVTWDKVANTEEMVFNMAAVMDKGDNHWMSIAFSDDREPGNDSAVECVWFEGQLQIYLSYSTRNPVNSYKLDADQNAVTNVSGSFLNGVFRCSFRRAVKVDNTSLIYDLDEDWYLLYSSGRMANDSDTKEEGTVHQIISDRTYTFHRDQQTTNSAVVNVKSTTPRSFAISIHMDPVSLCAVCSVLLYYLFQFE